MILKSDYFDIRYSLFDIHYFFMLWILKGTMNG